MQLRVRRRAVGCAGETAGRRTAVDAEDLVVNDHGECEEVEHVREVCPHVRGAVLAHALGVEPVRLGGNQREKMVAMKRDD